MCTVFARELFPCACFKKFGTYFPLKLTLSNKKIQSVPTNLKKVSMHQETTKRLTQISQKTHASKGLPSRERICLNQQSGQQLSLLQFLPSECTEKPSPLLGVPSSPVLITFLFHSHLVPVLTLLNKAWGRLQEVTLKAPCLQIHS